MKLLARLFVVQAVFTGLVLLSFTWSRVNQEVARSHAKMRAKAEAVARTVQELFPGTGEGAALRQALQDFNGDPQLEIRWVSLEEGADVDAAPRVQGDQLAAMPSGLPASFTLGSGEEQLHVTYFPLTTGAGPAALEISQQFDVGEAVRATFLRLMALHLTLLLVCLLVFGLLGYRLIARPLYLLTQRTQRIARGDCSPDPELARRRDEVGELALALNVMCRHLEQAQQSLQAEAEAKRHAQEQLQHADRLRTVGQTASSLAHDIATPLDFIGLKVEELVTATEKPQAVFDGLMCIREQQKRIHSSVQQMLDFARYRSTAKAETDLQDVLSSTISLLVPLARRREVELHCLLRNGPLLAHVDPCQLQQVLINITMNAIQVSPRQGRVELGLEKRLACESVYGKGILNW